MGITRPLDPITASVVATTAARRKGTQGRDALRPLEKEMQNTIVEFLIWHQCRVLSTSQHPRKTTCHKCGAQFHPSESLTTSPGLPDLLVRMNHWPAILGFPVGIEVKRDAKSPVRPMQREFAELGFVTICWTPEQAWEAVQRVDRLIQGIEG